jgi:hypothetical protein
MHIPIGKSVAINQPLSQLQAGNHLDNKLNFSQLLKIQ